MKIALTQSEGRLAGLAAALTECGHEVVRQPLIRTEPLRDDEVKGRAAQLLGCAWLLFSSPNAVEAWRALSLPLREIRPNIGVVGEKTAEVVRTFGGNVSLIGEPQNAEGLADAFLKQEVKGTVGLPRGERSLKTLQARLEAHNIQTFPVTIYKTVACSWTSEAVDAVVLASPSAAGALPEEVGGRVKLISLGPSTSAAIAKRGWRCVQAEAPSAEAVLKLFMTFGKEVA